jgi:hypothetical protein
MIENSADRTCENDSDSTSVLLVEEQNDAIESLLDLTDTPPFAEIPVATDVEITC